MASEDSALNHGQCVLALLARGIHAECQTRELEKPVSFRTACIRKLRDDDPPGEADALAAHGRMSFAYLPPARRLAASARTRVFSTRAGIWLVRKLRAPS